MLTELIEQAILAAMDDLLRDRPAATISRQALRHILEVTAQRVAAASRDDTLMSLKSSQEVADLYRTSRQSINTRAARLREQRGRFGWEVGRGVWAFTPDEVETLRPGQPGRPRKTESPNAP